MCEMLTDNEHQMTPEYMFFQKRTHLLLPRFAHMLYPCANTPSPIVLVIVSLLIETDKELAIFTSGKRAARRTLDAIASFMRVHSLDRRIVRQSLDTIHLIGPTASVSVFSSKDKTLRGFGADIIIVLHSVEHRKKFFYEVLCPLLTHSGETRVVFFTEGMYYFYDTDYEIIHENRLGYALKPMPSNGDEE